MRIIYDQTYYIVLHCEECGLMGGTNNTNYFEEAGHLVDFSEIRTPAQARQAQRVHQRWHDSLAGY
jgi:hypothetical protein